MKRIIFVLVIMAMSIAVLEAGLQEEIYLESSIEKGILYEVRVFPERRQVFAYTFYTRGEAIKFARLISLEGLTVSYCGQGPGIFVIFPTIRMIKVKTIVCDGPCATDEPCIPQ